MNHVQRLVVAAAAVVAMAVLGYTYLTGLDVGAPSPTLSPSQSSGLTPVPTASLPALGLPGTRGDEPAGEYGWQGQAGEMAGMHLVLPDGEATAMFFAAGSDCLDTEDRPATPVRVAGLDGVFVEPHEPPVVFSDVGDEITRGYAFAVGDRTLCVFLTWHPTTSEDEIDSAMEILDTLRAQPIGPDGIRITFTLPAGWDTG